MALVPASAELELLFHATGGPVVLTPAHELLQHLRSHIQCLASSPICSVRYCAGHQKVVLSAMPRHHPLLGWHGAVGQCTFPIQMFIFSDDWGPFIRYVATRVLTHDRYIRP